MMLVWRRVNQVRTAHHPGWLKHSQTTCGDGMQGWRASNTHSLQGVHLGRRTWLVWAPLGWPAMRELAAPAASCHLLLLQPQLHPALAFYKNLKGVCSEMARA
jgi:hypothetical protein